MGREDVRGSALSWLGALSAASAPRANRGDALRRGSRCDEWHGLDRIDIVEAGTFPGDGRPKPVAFPDPSDAELRGHVRIVGLARLIELKLASGMTAADRLRDLADVQEMIRELGLPREFGGRLDGSVRGEYERLWGTVGETDASQNDSLPNV